MSRYQFSGSVYLKQKRMRDYAFRQLRRHAAMIERDLARAAERAAGVRGLGTVEFWQGNAERTAEQARKIACECAIELGRYA